ncbi:MAG TPA: peptidoglycan-binding protein [Allosphingosinicella sp.]|nr:peptidoglycan-binding protein [Allosphingosinicella sp.]
MNSSLFAASADLASVAAGGRLIKAPETSDSVALIQQALLALEFDFSDKGIDGAFGPETGTNVSAFKTDRNVLPADPIVGPGTTQRLDLELAYLEGNAANPSALDPTTLKQDPFFAGVLEVQNAMPKIGQDVIDLFEFGDRLCLRLSLLLGPSIAALFGRIVEPIIFKDFCASRGPCTTEDFLDSDPGSTAYVDFLLVHNPLVDPARIGELASRRRPDILTHRSPREWYEIKPASISGAIGAWIKFNSIIADYAVRGLPYLPGTAYVPTAEIFLAGFVTPNGESLEVVLEPRRRAPGLIFWTLCIKGDYVAYFNRVRLAGGILAILVALGVALLPAAEAAAVAAAVAEIATGLGVILAPLFAT